MRIGYFLSCEELAPRELLDRARRAEAAGFHGLWLSDHYHPWVHAQGQSAFVWGVIGALSQVTSLPVTTAVTCPTLRMHPAVVAQAVATAAVQLEGRLSFGVGSGEALNEHVLGDVWPEADVRLEMLEEAVEVMRALWTGETVSHRGRHYTVEHAKLFTRPDAPPPVLVSGFGPKAVELAGRIGEGFCTTKADGDAIAGYRAAGGKGPIHAGAKVCYGADAQACVQTAHRLWPNDALPGELAQILPTPEHFEQAATLVTDAMIADSIPCGPDLEAHVASLQEYADAGVEELFVAQIGPEADGFFTTWAQEVLPRFG